MNLPPKLQRVLKKGKDKSQTKVSLQKRYDIDVVENTDSKFPSSGDENPSEPLRSTKDSDSSDPTVVGHYEGKTLVDLIPTGEQWQREKSVMKRKNQ